MLQCVSAQQPETWSTHLPWTEYAHNSQVSAAIGMSAFMLSLGYQPPLFDPRDGDRDAFCPGEPPLLQGRVAKGICGSPALFLPGTEAGKPSQDPHSYLPPGTERLHKGPPAGG